MRLKRLALALFMAATMSVMTAAPVVAQPQQFPEAPRKCEELPNSPLNSPFCGGLPNEEAIEHSCENPGRNPPHCP